jgi:hypothetical protein
LVSRFHYRVKGIAADAPPNMMAEAILSQPLAGYVGREFLLFVLYRPTYIFDDTVHGRPPDAESNR